MGTRHILVIDDDMGTRDALADILERAGFAVSTWEGNISLDTLCSGRRFQVAVVDFHLPFQNGLEVAQKLKQLQPECRVLLMSSELPAPEGLAASSGAVDRFLSKPFSKDVFLDAVSQLCLLAES